MFISQALPYLVEEPNYSLNLWACTVWRIEVVEAKVKDFSFLVVFDIRFPLYTSIYYINRNTFFSSNSCCKCLYYFHWVYFVNMFMECGRLCSNNLYLVYMLVWLGCWGQVASEEHWIERSTMVFFIHPVEVRVLSFYC